ncbi:MAG: DUF4494 domain-containing protein [Muribaculaceae bacterium]|nr:DUF4494 domain-containing protein [Muribaculaceae bacterium]
MMNNFYLSSVKYQKISESGELRPVTEHYLFEALSYTEAEARTIEELTPFISGEFAISDIKRPRLAEVILDSSADNRFYKIATDFITIDERTAAEKRSRSFMLVQASDFDSAVASFKEAMRGTMADYEIASVVETPILDYYPAKLSSDE